MRRIADAKDLLEDIDALVTTVNYAANTDIEKSYISSTLFIIGKQITELIKILDEI